MTGDIGRTVLLPAQSDLFFGDGAPNWTQGKNATPAKTSDEAIADRDVLVARLNRHSKRNLAATALAAKLGRCAENRRCLSGACPMCMRALQRWFVHNLDAFLKKDGRTFSVVSIVPRVGRFRTDRAANIFNGLRAAAIEAFQAAEINLVIGGLDPGFNEHLRGAFTPHGQLQLWAFTPTTDKRVKQFIREAFPAKGFNRRPVQFKAFNGWLAGIAYALKSDFVRRISLPKVVRRKDGSTVRRRNTRLRALRVAQQCDLALALDQAGLGSRLFLYGVTIGPDNGFSRKPKPAVPP